jgi:hypothetical protein
MDRRRDGSPVEICDGFHRGLVERRQLRGPAFSHAWSGRLDHRRHRIEHQAPPQCELRQVAPGGTSGRSSSTAAGPAAKSTPENVSPTSKAEPSRLQAR